MRYLSNSEVATFKRCRRKWWLSWYRNLQPINRPMNDALAKGGRVHEALAGLYDPDSPRNPLVVLEEVIERDMPPVSEDAEPELVAALRAGWTKDTDLERAMIEGYVEWLRETGVDSELVITSAERSLMAQLTETVILLGRLDAEAYHVAQPEQLLFIDHKTTQSFDTLVKRLNQDEQLLTYLLLRRANAVDGYIWGAMYNMLRKVKRTAAAKPPFYQRHTEHFNTKQVDTFIVRLMMVALDIEALVDKLDNATSIAHEALIAYPTPTKDCDWQCEHRAVCPMFDDGSRAEDMLASLFVETPLTIRYPELETVA